MPAASTSSYPLDALLRQTDDNLSKGFRAIKMKVGRARLAEDVERVAAHAPAISATASR